MKLKLWRIYDKHGKLIHRDSMPTELCWDGRDVSTNEKVKSETYYQVLEYLDCKDSARVYKNTTTVLTNMPKEWNGRTMIDADKDSFCLNCPPCFKITSFEVYNRWGVLMWKADGAQSCPCWLVQNIQTDRKADNGCYYIKIKGIDCEGNLKEYSDYPCVYRKE